MSRLSLFKSSASSKSSLSSGSPRSSMMSDASSPVSYVQFPGLALARRQSSTDSGRSQQSQADYAEMLDDDNMAWGKPKKSSRR